jgi:hypothetical protein
VERWMHHADSVILASLIHLLEHTLEDLREHDAAVLLPVGIPQPTTTTSTERTPMESAEATRHRHQLLYTTLGLANKFKPTSAARELQDAFIDLWVHVEGFERATRERGYRSRGLEMVLRRMGPVCSYAARPPVSVERDSISECRTFLSSSRLNKVFRPNYSVLTRNLQGIPTGTLDLANIGLQLPTLVPPLQSSYSSQRSPLGQERNARNSTPYSTSEHEAHVPNVQAQHRYVHEAPTGGLSNVGQYRRLSVVSYLAIQLT